MPVNVFSKHKFKYLQGEQVVILLIQSDLLPSLFTFKHNVTPHFITATGTTAHFCGDRHLFATVALDQAFPHIS